MKADTVNSTVDPMGTFPGVPTWKVIDYVGGSLAELAFKMMDVRVVDSLKRMGCDYMGVHRGDPAAAGMFGCCPGAMPSSGMLKRDRPMDPNPSSLLLRNE